MLLPFFLDTLGWEPGNSRRFLLSWTTSAWKRAPCRVHKHIVVSPIWRRGQHGHAHHSSAIFSCAVILAPPHISTRNYSSVIHPSNPPHIKQDPLVTDHHRSASQSSRVFFCRPRIHHHTAGFDVIPHSFHVYSIHQQRSPSVVISQRMFF